MKNQEIYKQAFSALQPKGDLLPRVEKRRRPAFSNGMRRLAVAAVLCALMAVGAVAVYRGWSFTFAFDGNRRYQVTLEEVDVEKAPKTLEKLYCPTALPGNAALWRVSGDPEQGSAEWEWQVDYVSHGDDWQLTFEQYTLDKFDGGLKMHTSRDEMEIEEVLLGDLPVTRVLSASHLTGGTARTVYLYWTDGEYGYVIRHNGPEFFSEADQTAMVQSLASVTQKEHLRLKETYAVNDPVSYALKKLWVPDIQLQGLKFFWDVEDDAVFWGFENPQGYSISCLQQHIDSKSHRDDEQTVYQWLQAIKREDLTLGGKQVFTQGPAHEALSEIYILAAEDVFCYLSVDEEVARSLGLTREELAARVLESMTLMERPAAELALEALQ